MKVPKKSQDAYWQDIEPQTEEAKTDYVGGVKEFLFQVTPGLIIVAALVYGAYYLSSQVIGAKSNRPPLGEVSGTVTLNGKPLAYATVKFIPVENEENNKAPSAGLTDEQGNYRLLYVKDVPGAAIGEHQVVIEAKDQRGRERLPAEYNLQSVLRKPVAEGSQKIDFDLQVQEEDQQQ